MREERRTHKGGASRAEERRTHKEGASRAGDALFVNGSD
jgi:hypothetical protein